MLRHRFGPFRQLAAKALDRQRFRKDASVRVGDAAPYNQAGGAIKFAGGGMNLRPGRSRFNARHFVGRRLVLKGKTSQ